MKKKKYGVGLCLAGATVSALMLQGCTADKNKEGVTEIELVQYKQEAVAIFEELEKKFNETHEEVSNWRFSSDLRSDSSGRMRISQDC